MPGRQTPATHRSWSAGHIIRSQWHPRGRHCVSASETCARFTPTRPSTPHGQQRHATELHSSSVWQRAQSAGTSGGVCAVRHAMSTVHASAIARIRALEFVRTAPMLAPMTSRWGMLATMLAALTVRCQHRSDPARRAPAVNPAAWSACDGDEACVSVPFRCCACGAGDHVPTNRANREAAQSLHRPIGCNACPQQDCPRIVAHCVHGTCQLND